MSSPLSIRSSKNEFVIDIVVLMTLFGWNPGARAETVCELDSTGQRICSYSDSGISIEFIIGAAIVGGLLFLAALCGVLVYIRRHRASVKAAKDPMAGFSPAMAYAPQSDVSEKGITTATLPSTYDPNGLPQYPEPVAAPARSSYPFVGYGTSRYETKASYSAEIGTAV